MENSWPFMVIRVERKRRLVLCHTGTGLIVRTVVNRDHKSVDIKSMIRNIRGQQVMLDFELAMLYGVKTSALNQAVKRNINRFPEDFMFQLTKNELESLKSQIVTSKSVENQKDNVLISQIVTSKPIEKRGGTQKPPYAFTRNGIGMLSSVLRSETAVGVNIYACLYCYSPDC